jgi:hypothetical protein
MFIVFYGHRIALRLLIGPHSPLPPAPLPIARACACSRLSRAAAGLLACRAYCRVGVPCAAGLHQPSRLLPWLCAPTVRPHAVAAASWLAGQASPFPYNVRAAAALHLLRPYRHQAAQGTGWSYLQFCHYSFNLHRLFVLRPIRVVQVALVSSRRALRDSTKVFIACVFLYISLNIILINMFVLAL